MGGDPSGHGEGQFFLGTINPDPSGQFEAILPPVAPGILITATATDANGNTSEFAANVAARLPEGLSKAGISTEPTAVPEKFGLSQNYPNPFNPETEIHFQLPEASQVLVRIFNTLGQEIRTLTDREYEAGFHSLRWDSKDNKGNAVSSGIYLYQLQAGSFSQIRKMTLLR